MKSIEAPFAVDCPVLKKVVIPDSITEIDRQAFVNCPQLTIYTTAGAYAEKYARENNIPVKLLDSMAEYTRLTVQKWPSIQP